MFLFILQIVSYCNLVTCLMMSAQGDDVVYVNNPIEAGLPGHWVPLSVIKRVIEMRVSPANYFTRPEKIILKHLTHFINKKKTTAKVTDAKTYHNKINSGNTLVKTGSTKLSTIAITMPTEDLKFTAKNTGVDPNKSNKDEKGTIKDQDTMGETTIDIEQIYTTVFTESTASVGTSKVYDIDTTYTTEAPVETSVTLTSTNDVDKEVSETTKKVSTIETTFSTTDTTVFRSSTTTSETILDVSKLLTSSTTSAVSTTPSTSTFTTTVATTMAATDATDLSTGDPFY